ncbi:MAG: HesA/MoeB/ThiF family protein [bacterium]
MSGVESKKLGRYLRTIMLSEIGKRGQEKLYNSKVGVIGVGGLGSPVLLYLASCGIGNITIVDFDKVNLIDLQRQVIYTEEDIGQYKVIAAQKNIKKINSEIKIDPINTILSEENKEYFVEVFKNFDCLIDATDNIPTRYLIDDIVKTINSQYRKSDPLYWVMGAVFKFEGIISVFDSVNYSYRKTFPNFREVSSCQEVGVLPTTTAVIGSLQANEAIKIILKTGEFLFKKLLIIKLDKNEFDLIKLDNI